MLTWYAGKVGNKLILGFTVGFLLGWIVGLTVGVTVGNLDGVTVGISVGTTVGTWPETVRMETINRNKNIWMLNIFSIRSSTEHKVFA